MENWVGWLLFYVLPMILNFIGIYIYFRVDISEEKNSEEKRNLYELFKRCNFFIWMAIIPIANIIMIISSICIYLWSFVKNRFENFAKKIKI